MNSGDEPAKFEVAALQGICNVFSFSCAAFLYGEGGDRNGNRNLVSPRIRVFRRKGRRPGADYAPSGTFLPETFDVAHVDLYFFYDIDIAILADGNRWAKNFAAAGA